MHWPGSEEEVEAEARLERPRGVAAMAEAELTENFILTDIERALKAVQENKKV